MPAPEVPAALQRPYSLREVRRNLEQCQASIDRCVELLRLAQLGIVYVDWCRSDLDKAQDALRQIARQYHIDLLEQG